VGSFSAVLLYNSAVSGNCYKVRLLLAQLGLEYETVDVSVVDRSNRRELLVDLNPALRVPTLVLDDARRVERDPLVLRRRHSVCSWGPVRTRPGSSVAVL
jgi:glutathione S-transferase